VEIAPGLRAYMAKNLIQGANAYRIDAGGSRLLIDAPKWAAAQVLRESELEHGWLPSHIFVTHCDQDHVGGLWQMLDGTHAAVVCQEAEAPLLEARADRPTRYPLGVRFPMFDRPTRKHPIRVDVAVADGAVVAGLTVLHTPGHTPGSACFWWRERSVLLVGDLFMNRGKLTKPFSWVTPDPATWLHSARRIAELDFDICCFGHGPPIIGDASRTIRDFVARL
jgi:glyoxylase-like metal-dependent hydrolase (beta-lactamase superfamily II)